jgi:hypothetical protein
MSWSIDTAKFANRATGSKAIPLRTLHFFITGKSGMPVKHEDSQSFTVDNAANGQLSIDGWSQIFSWYGFENAFD